MTAYKRIWIQTFIALLLLLPGLPYVVFALYFLLNRIGLQGLLPTSPLIAIFKAYFALPSRLCGHDLNHAGWGGIVAATAFYGLIALGLAFPVSKWIVRLSAKKAEKIQPDPPDQAAGGEARGNRRKTIGMKKRAIRAVCIGAFILIALYAAKGLLVQYRLFQYRRLWEAFEKGCSLERLKNDNSFSALIDLGYLARYEIPIRQPHADAEKRLELITMVLFKHGIPAYATMEDFSGSPQLLVTDRPDRKKAWETYARMYLEARDDRPPVAGQAPQSGGDPEP